MKKMHWLAACGLLMIFVFVSCSYDDHSAHYSVSESDNYFSIRAKYNRQHSPEVDRFMTNFFESRNNHMSFKNTVLDADLTLDDGTTFYIKKTPGYLSIKFNKAGNSTASYIEMKALGKKLKTVITQQ